MARPTTTRPTRRSAVGKRTRQVLIFLHVSMSVGWMGAGAANVVLAGIGARTDAADVRRVCYLLIDRIDFYLVIPLAFTALASGVLVSFATPWGLLRFWWVLVKTVLTLAVIVYSTFGVGVWVEQSIQATTAGGTVSPVALTLPFGAAGNLIAFLFMTFISFAKPWGPTPWWRARGRPTRVARPT